MNYPIYHEYDRIVQQAKDSGWPWEELERELKSCWPDGPEQGGDGWTDQELAEAKAEFDA